MLNNGYPIFGELPYRNAENMRVLADAERTDTLISWKATIMLEDGLRILIDSEAGNS